MQCILYFEMNVVESASGNSPNTVSVATPVIFLNSNCLSGYFGNPGDMSVVTSIGLSNTACFWSMVNGDMSTTSCLIPGIGIAPVGPLVVVVELDF